MSHSVWSAWIEISNILLTPLSASSHSVWSAWIEMIDGEQGKIYVESHSVWSAWIEIYWNCLLVGCFSRTPFGVRG